MLIIGIMLIVIFGIRWLYLILTNDEDDISDEAKKQRKQKEIISAIMTTVGLIISVIGLLPDNETIDTPTQAKTSPLSEIKGTINFESQIALSPENTTTTTPPKDNIHSVDLAKKTTVSNTETSNTTKSNDLHTISPIAQNSLIVDLIKNKETLINNVDFIIYNGFLGYKGQIDEYSITPLVSGTYRFDISNTLSSTKVSIKILDNTNNVILDSYSFSSNQGVSAILEAGVSYTVQVKQSSGIDDNYALTIGQPKESVDVSDYSIINDSIQFKDQMNVYLFTPPIDGRYRFDFSELKYGIKLSIGIYDSKENEIRYSSGLGNGNGTWADLSANEEYSIKVSQNGDFGEYILNIGKQKKSIDISNYTQITDNIEYKNQQNIYTYTPKIDGHYYIYFNEIPNGSDINLFVENRLGETLRNNTFTIYNNKGVSYDLKGGEQYTIYIAQHNNYSLYQMNIGIQKETTDITSYSQINDSIEYQTQQNNYTFIPNTSSDYNLHFKGMKNEFVLYVVVLNDLNYEEAENSYVVNDKTLELKNLTAGQTYTIQITQQSDYGEYTFEIS